MKHLLNIIALIAAQPFFAQAHDLEEKIETLKRLGVRNPQKVLDRHPSLLNMSADTMGSKYDSLQKIGFENPQKVIGIFPDLLFLDIETTVVRKINDLRTLGFTRPVRLIESNPRILGIHAERKIKPKMDALGQIGFRNAKAMVESYPPILNLHLEENLLPTAAHLLEVWGLTLEEIEFTPRILGYSLSRLKDLATTLTVYHLRPNSIPFEERIRTILTLSGSDIRENLKNLKATTITPQNWNDVLRRNETCVATLSSEESGPAENGPADET